MWIVFYMNLSGRDEKLWKIKFSRYAKRRAKMNVFYDNEVDALYIKLSESTPDGVIEISEGVNLDTASDGKLVGIEILKASLKIDINTIIQIVPIVFLDLIKRWW